MEMNNFIFWLTLLIVGMGGTLAALAVLVVLMELLKKIFPAKTQNTSPTE